MVIGGLRLPFVSEKKEKMNKKGKRVGAGAMGRISSGAGCLMKQCIKNAPAQVMGAQGRIKIVHIHTISQ